MLGSRRLPATATRIRIGSNRNSQVSVSDCLHKPQRIVSRSAIDQHGGRPSIYCSLCPGNHLRRFHQVAIGTGGECDPSFLARANRFFDRNHCLTAVHRKFRKAADRHPRRRATRPVHDVLLAMHCPVTNRAGNNPLAEQYCQRLGAQRERLFWSALRQPPPFWPSHPQPIVVWCERCLRYGRLPRRWHIGDGLRRRFQVPYRSLEHSKRPRPF